MLNKLNYLTNLMFKNIYINNLRMMGRVNVLVLYESLYMCKYKRHIYQAECGQILQQQQKTRCF